ncbi:MAG: hypothetical protein ACKV22_08630 [Bryobacteraceae bacterium]
MTLREQILEYRRRMNAFNEWEAQTPQLDMRDPADIVDDFACFDQWIPDGVRSDDRDPEKKGIEAYRGKMDRLFGPS